MKILFRSGRKAVEIAFPSHQGEWGTCDFMTKQCATKCLLPIHDSEIEAYKFFLCASGDYIFYEMNRQALKMGASNIAWFVESGDCPRKLTNTIYHVMRKLSDNGWHQNGFTRNRELWGNSQSIDNMNLCLTVETEDEASKFKNNGLVSIPNYDNWTVKIMKANQIINCGGGGVTCGSGAVKDIEYEQEEDCSICFENENGCYLKVA